MRLPSGPHRPEAQDVALSRPKHGFESRWGRHRISSLPAELVPMLVALVPRHEPRYALPPRFLVILHFRGLIP